MVVSLKRRLALTSILPYPRCMRKLNTWIVNSLLDYFFYYCKVLLAMENTMCFEQKCPLSIVQLRSVSRIKFAIIPDSKMEKTLQPKGDKFKFEWYMLWLLCFGPFSTPMNQYTSSALCCEWRCALWIYPPALECMYFLLITFAL